MRPVYASAAAIALVFGMTSLPAPAATIGFSFNATLLTGAFTGTNFSGTGSYDTSGSTGMGQEFLTLTTLDFTLLGVPFTRADIFQGGQAILQNGALTYFTAAFFPPPPPSAPVNDMAFGFGGPGIIGYSTPPGSNFGSGIYTLSPSPIPEPAALKLVALGLSVLAFRWAMGDGRPASMDQEA